MPDAPLPDCLLEQITVQQAHIAVLAKRLEAAEGAVGSAVTTAAVAVAHARADDALIALEAAEDILRGLVAERAAACPGLRTAGRRLRAVPVAGQHTLFDVG